MKARPSPRAEIALGLAVFAVYSVVSGLDWSGREGTAHRHADSIVRLEQWLHLDIEPALNDWLSQRSWLRVAANYEYATTYVISAFALLLWLYRRRPEIYRWARTSFVWLNLLGVGCFALYPLAPPRLLSADYGFTDTVRQGNTWGSWGSPLVGHANQLAAMPSLHIAWAIWVSVVLIRIHGGWRTQVVSGIHVLVTAWVIMATGNHYLIDALAAVVLVLICIAITGSPDKVAAADAFFLHVENTQAPQHVGGVVQLEGVLSREQALSRLQDTIELPPRFTQVLHERGRWGKPRWVPAGPLDWDWHVPLIDLTGPHGTPGGEPALNALVASLAQTVLPRDRPLWRLIVVNGLADDSSAVVLLVHHAVSDGIGTVAQVLVLFEPAVTSVGSQPSQPGFVRRASAMVIGLSQLARDPRPDSRLPSSSDAQRSFATVEVALPAVQAVARSRDARVSDVLLAAVAEGLHSAVASLPQRLLVAVPLTLRDPQSAAEGNVTAAVVAEVPLGATSSVGDG